MSMIQLGAHGRSDGFRFDTSRADWKPFVTEGCLYRILDVNVPAGTAEMLVKFEPHGRCLYHRHQAAVKTLVLEGELHLYEPTPEGEVHSIKPAGSFSMGAGGEVHIEGAEDQPCIVYFSMSTKTDVIYEILDRDLNLKRAITVQDFHDDWQQWLTTGAEPAQRMAG
jgi:quercetin dioxygenase-like cupin family protein